MHELSAADALRPSPVCILDLPLAEYSLGHELLLFRRRNALAVLSSEEFSKLDFSAQIYAIREAVWLCSDSFSARDRFERPARIMWGFRWNEWKRKRWVKRLANLLPEDYALAAAEFRNYMAASQRFPPMPTPHAVSVLYPNDNEESGRGFGQPLFLTLYHFVSALPKSVLLDNGPTGSVWDFPYARAIWLYTTKCEMEGAFRIENAKERQVQEEKDQFLKEIAEEKAAEDASRRTEAGGRKPEDKPNMSGLATPPPDLGPDLPSSNSELQNGGGM